MIHILVINEAGFKAYFRKGIIMMKKIESYTQKSIIKRKWLASFCFAMTLVTHCETTITLSQTCSPFSEQVNSATKTSSIDLTKLDFKKTADIQLLLDEVFEDASVDPLLLLEKLEEIGKIKGDNLTLNIVKFTRTVIIKLIKNVNVSRPMATGIIMMTATTSGVLAQIRPIINHLAVNVSDGHILCVSQRIKKSNLYSKYVQ